MRPDQSGSSRNTPVNTGWGLPAIGKPDASDPRHGAGGQPKHGQEGSIEEVMQHLEVRELLEGFMIRHSLPFLGDGELGEMRGILSEMKKCIKLRDLLQYSQQNWRSHDVIYRVCPNRPAVERTMSIKNQLKRYHIKTMLIQGRGEDSLDEQGKILSALERRDAGLPKR